jgi:hypothetical protein
MIPDNELSNFVVTVWDAVDLAGDGEAVFGYEVLLAGQEIAEELHAGGHEWAAELVERYMEARGRFAARWGVGRA